MPELNTNLPVFEALVRNEFLYNFKKGHGEFSRAAVFGVASVPGRALGFHCLLGNGACYSRLPILALASRETAEPSVKHVSDLQLWDAPSEHISCITYDLLQESRCKVYLPCGEVNGTYMFTLDWHGSSYADSAGALGWKCIGEGSLVLTENGYTPIEDVEIGTKVLTHRGNWKPIIRKNMSISEKLCSFKGKGHPELKITSDHKILTYCSSGVTAAWEDIAEARNWASLRNVEPLPVPNDYELTPALMRFIGAWLGDGTLDLSQRTGRPTGQLAGRVILTSGTQPDEVKRCKETIENCGFKYTEILSTRKTAYLYPIYDKKLSSYLLKNFGRYSYGKYLPGWVFGLSKELKEALLQGYCETDGNQETSELISITSVSKPLIFGFKQLAETIGYTGSMYIRRRHEAKIIICGGKPCSTRDAWVLKIRKFNPAGKYRGTVTDTHIMSPITGHTKIDGANRVWDLEVADDNSFVVEGVVVHNCSHFIRLDNGYFCAQPNNKILFKLPCWTKIEGKPDYALTTTTYKCEQDFTTTDEYFYNVETEIQSK